MHIHIAMTKGSRYENRQQCVTAKVVVNILGYIGNQSKLSYVVSFFGAKCQVVELIDITVMKPDINLINARLPIPDRLYPIIGVAGNADAWNGSLRGGIPGSRRQQTQCCRSG